ncbi:MAG: cytochrome c [Bacteroidetes bacterium]|nr:MAG: cytochrome c [Bacteroidota bacterium]
MKQVLAFVLIGFFVVACGNGNDSTSNTSSSQMAASKPIDGEKIYKNYCVTCHGLYGDMGASGAHDLTVSNLTLEQRIEIITKGRNTMTPFEGLLSPEKIKAVAEYTMTLKKK